MSDFGLTATRLLTFLCLEIEPQRRLEMAEKIRALDGDRIEREFFESVAAGLERLHRDKLAESSAAGRESVQAERPAPGGATRRRATTSTGGAV